MLEKDDSSSQGKFSRFSQSEKKVKKKRRRGSYNRNYHRRLGEEPKNRPEVTGTTQNRVVGSKDNPSRKGFLVVVGQKVELH